MQVKLSACLIIKNEEKNLFRCLSSVKNIADEIIVVDTGSIDSSVEIARTFTEHVYNFNWNNNFSTARNFGLDKAAGDWILVLDGDEELNIASLELVHNIIETGDAEAYFLKVVNPDENDSELALDTDLILRLFKNRNEYRYKGIVYEEILSSILSVNPDAIIGTVKDFHIVHHAYSEEKVEAGNSREYNMNLLRTAAAEETGNLLKHFHMGVNHYRQQQYEQALSLFLPVYKQVDKASFYLPELMRKIALSYYATGNLQEVLNFIDNEWIKAFPDMQDIYYIKGAICKHMGDYIQAYMAFQQFLSLPHQAGDNTSIYFSDRDKSCYYLGSLAEYFMDMEQALNYYLQSLRENPRMLISLKRIISILQPRINPEYTINSLKQVFDLSDKSLQANLAAIFFEEGAYQLALERLDILENGTQLSEKMTLLRGLCLMRSGHYDAAVKELNAINRDKIFFIQAQQNLLLYYWLQHDESKLIRCLQNIKKVGANMLLLEILSAFTGKKDQDIKKLQANKQQANELIKDIMGFLVELGTGHSIDKAWENLSFFVGTRPSTLLAELFYKWGKYDLALKEYRQLIETEKTDARTIYYLGKSCWGQENLEAAAVYLQQAIEKGLNIPKVRRELIKLYQELAIRTLREEISSCPDNQELPEILQQMEDNLLPV